MAPFIPGSYDRPLNWEWFNRFFGWTIGDPIRALTVGVTKLVPADQVVEQVSLFDDNAERGRQEKLEMLVDDLRDKHGEGSITLGYQENREIGVIRGRSRRQKT